MIHPGRGILAATFVLGLVVGAATASPIVFSQPYDADLGALNSNTSTNPGDVQQIADDFVLSQSGRVIDQVDLWFTYGPQGSTQEPPATQDLLVRVYDDVGGLPGSVLYEEAVSFAPVSLGVVNGSGLPLYHAEVPLSGFLATGGQTYWLNPLGATDSVVWSWQNHTASGSIGARGRAGVWYPLSRELAFALHATPEPTSLALVVLGGVGLVVGLRRRRRK